jgi:enoyl-CoA hydratase
MDTSPVHYEVAGGVAAIRLDDGKANALGPATIAAIHGALDRAERDARAVVLAGRPGRFSAGFDLKVMRQGRAELIALVTAGAELGLRLYEFPRPVVVACTGHAMAMGAILLLCADTRIGTDGDFKIGLNEVAIGLTLPAFGVELARDRLSKRHLTRATVTAELYAPTGAVAAGFLDRLAPTEVLLAEARAEADRLGALERAAFAGTKRRLRHATIARIRAGLQEDIQGMTGTG